MADENERTVKWLEIILGVLVGVIVTLSELEIYRRVVIIIVVLALMLSLVIFRRLRVKSRNRPKIETSNGSPPQPAVKYLVKNAPFLCAIEGFLILISIVGFFLALFPELMNTISSCTISNSTPAISPTPIISLSDAHIEFTATFNDGSQKKIPANGTLTLLLDDKIVIKVSVVNVDRSPYPHELSFQYNFASGGSFTGDTATYVARQLGEDIITTRIEDNVSSDEIVRSMRVVVK
jgi:hypothetical protein